MGEREDERTTGGGADGDGLGDDDGPTVVIVSRDFLIGSLGRTANALFGAGGVCLDARALITAGQGKAALSELREEVGDLRDILLGLQRAIERLEFEEG